MILDNRQVVPDIVVSRDGVPNHAMPYNINVNNNNIQGLRINREKFENPPDAVEGRNSPRHIMKGKAVRETHPASVIYPPYVTGNNNGSPRHVPHNGNFHSEAKGVAYSINNGANKIAKLASPLPLRRFSSQQALPLQFCESPKLKKPPRSPIHMGSPLHQMYRATEQKDQNYFDFCSNPSRLTKVIPGSPRRGSANPSTFLVEENNPKQFQEDSKIRNCNTFYSPQHGVKTTSGIPRSPRLQALSKVFRPRSSSHPCDQIEAVRTSESPSKIPVHVPKLKHNPPSSEEISKMTNKTNNLNSEHHNKIAQIISDSNYYGDIQKTDLKSAAKDLLAQRSPKHFKNIRSGAISNYERRVGSPTPNNIMLPSSPISGLKYASKNLNSMRKNSLEMNGDTLRWNSLSTADSSDSSSWNNIDCSDRSEEENDRIYDDNSINRSGSWSSSTNVCCDVSKWEEENPEICNSVDRDVWAEGDNSSVSPKMVLIKCKDANYLTRMYVNNEGIHGLRVVGRVGVGGSAHNHGMSTDQSSMTGDQNSNHCSDLVRRNDISSSFDAEFEHETADYQWLLDYEYRESFTRESFHGGGRDGVARVSVLQPSREDSSDINYETLSRNMDANLAEIDMDDFRSEDINQFLVLPSLCSDVQNEDDGEVYCSMTDSMLRSARLQSSVSIESTRCVHHQQQLKLHQHLLRQQLKQQQQQEEVEEQQIERCRQRDCEDEEESSVICGDVSSLYQSGPLFSPLKEPPHIPPSFSVDSLDSDSIHEDLILTCQANKDNYTIAFEGSFIHYSEDSSEGCSHETAESDGSGMWSTQRLEGRSPAPNMTHSDQPYTTWSRVSLRSSHSSTPDQSQLQCSRQRLPSIEKTPDHKHHPAKSDSSKSNSMPNLMRKSLMKRSLETSGQCVKVFDLQHSLRLSQLNNARSVDANNFSLMRLFIKQKSLSKEQISLSSSCTDPSAEGGSSSDWPMNSQSDMDGSSSPVPSLEKVGCRRRGNSPHIIDYAVTETSNVEGTPNNNNIMLDNINPIDNVTSFEDSLKDPSPCSKAPMTSPIREEPEEMDISIDSKGETKALFDQSEKETIAHHQPILRLKDSKTDLNVASHKVISKEINNKNIQGKSKLNNIRNDEKPKSRSSIGKLELTKDAFNGSQRKRQDSGNTSSGYLSNRGSTEKIKRSTESEKLLNLLEKPKPKPRFTKQMADQCLQTSNITISATNNTSELLEKKEVYVYYPNYALPDLGFLKDRKYGVDAKIFLVPQHYVIQPQDAKFLRDKRSKRPFSCGDMDRLRKHGFKHIKDWESLNFLLPKELKEMLMDESDCMETTKPSFCKTMKSANTCGRPASCECGQTNDFKVSGNSLNSTQPSSGFRGSSTMLNDSSESDPRRSLDERFTNDGDNEEVAPPRPPLPRGILRKCTSLRDDNKQGIPKRYSTGDSNRSTLREELLKRRSLQEPIDLAKSEGDRKEDPIMSCSCMEECTGFCGKGLRKKNLLQVTELPDVSSHEDLTEEDLARLRSQVSEFLVTKGGQVGSVLAGDTSIFSCDCPKKSVSFAEKSRNLRRGSLSERKVPHNTPTRSNSGDCLAPQKKSVEEDHSPMLYDAHDKKTLVLSVRSGVEKLLKYFNNGATQQDKIRLGNSSQTPEVAQLVLDKLCPAIYALLSDGLLPALHSLFGKISNSVWRVIEATSQMGASTKALNDLVLTLNSEEGLSEGPLKFNAFIFGLLNIRSLDAWLGYLRTRESALQKHYHPESFLYLSNTAMRFLFDDLLLALRPLALLPFRLDLLHEYKVLHASLLKMEERLAIHTSMTSEDIVVAKESKELRNTVARTTDRSRSPRPRSCHENVGPQENHHNVLKKRWSNVQMGSKLATAIDRLMAEDNSSSDYTDSLDNPRRLPLDLDDQMTDMRVSDLSSHDGDVSERSATDKDTDTEKGIKHPESEGEKFRRLQLKWEAMTLHQQKNKSSTEDIALQQMVLRRDNSVSPAGVQRSRIPRPVSITSPLQNFKPFDPNTDKTSPHPKQSTRKTLISPKEYPKPAPRRSLKDRVVPTDNAGTSVRSRLGLRSNASAASSSSVENRASSVPGRRINSGSRYELPRKNNTPRSASQGRSHLHESRLVQTLHHRLATDNGHLSFSRGDVLTVVVEVDERFLLCCLHDRKGLVPRSSVLPIHQ